MLPVLDHENLRTGGTTEIEKEVFTATHKVLSYAAFRSHVKFPVLPENFALTKFNNQIKL